MTHRLLFFSREAISETYGPRVSFSYYWPLRSTFSLLLFSDLLNQKYKNTLLRFIIIYFICRSIYQSITTFSRPLANFWRRYPKGIDNPFNTSVCEYLLFVCRCRSRSVAWFSYWFDNLGLITEGNTYRCCAASSLPLWGNTDVVQANIKTHRKRKLHRIELPEHRGEHCIEDQRERRGHLATSYGPVDRW